jgi:hypothetical protein
MFGVRCDLAWEVLLRDEVERGRWSGKGVEGEEIIGKGFRGVSNWRVIDVKLEM